MSEREGPQQVTRWTCYGCKWHETDWIYDYVSWCHIDDNKYFGEDMPEDGETPPWCPLLPKEEPQP